jgi:LmbE family N-acetylglucosaminyl deacetylase
MGHPAAAHHVDITAQVERKIEALLCHESQHVDPQRTERVVREWAMATASRFGLPEGCAAEAFRLVDTR